jgi:hypothetical protein
MTGDARIEVAVHEVRIGTVESRLKAVEEKLDRAFWAALTAAAAAIANFVATHLTK